LKAKNLSPPMI